MDARQQRGVECVIREAPEAARIAQGESVESVQREAPDA